MFAYVTMSMYVYTVVCSVHAYVVTSASSLTSAHFCNYVCVEHLTLFAQCI